MPLRDAWSGEKIVPSTRTLEIPIDAYGVRVIVPDTNLQPNRPLN